MASIVFALCALTSLAAAWLLFRSFARNRRPLLFWSGLCFAGLAANNILLTVDRVLFPMAVDLSTWRLVPAFVGLLLLIYGLVSADE